eukprot:jgi/Botrbrau1/17554/Bobra.0166s0002.1
MIQALFQALGRACPGFSVLPVHSLEHWPEGNPPKSHKEEFPTVTVEGQWAAVSVDGFCEGPAITMEEGLPNFVEPRTNFRGCLNIRDEEVVTFWKAFAPASLTGSPLFKRLRLEDGVSQGKVVLLKNEEDMEAELEKAADFMKTWLDPEFVSALKERDEILRASGFPDNPPESWRDVSRYRREYGIEEEDSKFFNVDYSNGVINYAVFTVLGGLDTV